MPVLKQKAGRKLLLVYFESLLDLETIHFRV